MKIFFNTYPVAFQCAGGGEIQLIKSKEALERRGHEVILFNQWEHKLSEADVVHQFSVQGGIYNLCAYTRAQKIPLVLSPILWLSEYIDQYPMGEIGYMTSVADVICPNSQAEVDRFLQHFDAPASKYHVTHNGVDALFFHREPADLFLAEYNIDRPFILCVGNIETRKNQLSLLKAASNIGQHVVLIGNIRDQNYFAQLENEFRGQFSYIGFLEHDSPLLRSAYAACTTFALPSLLETPGLAALEAAAAGTPLVITKEGCTTEYFDDAAYYADPKDVGDIARKLMQAINAGRDKCNLSSQVERFSWDLVAEELEQAYLKAIATHTG